jgi:ABC-type hemin transport system substrate-binding protein
MGCGDRVVGVTEYCVHPRDEVADLPKVGGSKLPDLELLFSLKPDLVVMNEEENRIEDFEEIEGRGIAIVRTFPKKVLDTAAMLRDVGRAVGCEDAAGAIAREVEAAVANAKNTSAAKRKIRAICLIWMRPFMTLNSDTFVHDMLDICGIENPYGADATRYPKIAKEDLHRSRHAAGLDAVLLPSEPFEFVPQHATEIAALAGLPTPRAVLCDGQYLSWYGSRTPAGIAYTLKLADKIRAMPPAE